uniref:Uncharacterized protein n=1 Tax=Rhizophora mucronata TaxID=61149 RepID=A0A2P2K9H3_RHIMU
MLCVCVCMVSVSGDAVEVLFIFVGVLPYYFYLLGCPMFVVLFHISV